MHTLLTIAIALFLVCGAVQTVIIWQLHRLMIHVGVAYVDPIAELRRRLPKRRHYA